MRARRLEVVLKKKKKYLPMVILLVVLLALSVCYAVLLSANKKAEEKAAAETGLDDKIIIADYDLNELRHIEFTSESGTVSLSVSGENVWINDDDESFPIDQDKLDGMAKAITEISAERAVEKGEPADYGLEEPAITILANYSDGASHTYKIGDVNSFNSKTYFMADEKIYMISDNISTLFKCEVNDLIKISDSFPSDIENDYVSKITVRNDDGTIAETSDSEQIEELMKLIKQNVNYSSWAAYGLDADKKSDEYGISDDSARIVIDYKRKEAVVGDDGTESTTRIDTSYEISFGGSSDESEYYYSTPKSDMVYKMSEESRASLINYLFVKADSGDETES